MIQVSLTEILLNFVYKLFQNFKTFNLSFKYPKEKSYLIFFINYWYNFKTIKLSFKYY